MKNIGSVLIIVLGFSFLLAALAFSVLSLLIIRRHAFKLHSEQTRIRYELEGALELCAQRILKAPYKNGKNTLLFTAAKTGKLFSLNGVNISVRRMNNCYEIIVQKDEKYPRYRVWVKEKSIPKGFVLFVLDDDLNVTNSTYESAIFVRGDIRLISDKEVEFKHPLYAGGRLLFSSVAVTDSEFGAGYLERLSLKPLLDEKFVESLRREIPQGEKVELIEGARLLIAPGAIVVHPDKNTLVSLTFKEKEVVVSSTFSKGHRPKRYLRIPKDGLILVEGDVYVSGRLKTEVTVASTGSIYIVDDIVYVDAKGYEPLQKNNEKNKEYSGIVSLALVARDDIIYKPRHKSLIICGLLVALKGSIRPAADCKAEKLVIYGVRICRKRPYRLRKGIGFASAEYLYDANLLNSPPRFAPLLNIPSFHALKVENHPPKH